MKREHIYLTLIILGAFLVRLYKIDNPIADWHSWRQADTASVSRNYYTKGIDLLYPTYHDISSIQTGYYNPLGYRFVEFPMFNAVHAMLAKVVPAVQPLEACKKNSVLMSICGSDDFLNFEYIGRLLSIFFSLLTTVFIYFLGKRYIGNSWAGLSASFFFAFIPYSIYFSRVILPEPLGVCLAIGSLWFFTQFIDTDKYRYLFLSAILFALSMLIKPFVLFYLLPVAYLIYKKYKTIPAVLKDKWLLIAIDIALIPFFLWRAWIGNYPQGIPHFTWAFNGDVIRFHPSFWRWIFGERIGKLILGVWGLVPFSIGLVRKSRRGVFIVLFMAGTVLYTMVLATASVRHDYYQIFLIPAIALVLAKGANDMWNGKGFNTYLSRAVLAFSVFMMFFLGWTQIKEFYKVDHPEIIAAGKAVDRIAPKDALIIAPYNGDTAFLYQTKRWGWPVVEESFDELIEKGADYYVSVNFADPDTTLLQTKYQTVEKTDRYIVIDLGKALKAK